MVGFKRVFKRSGSRENRKELADARTAMLILTADRGGTTVEVGNPNLLITQTLCMGFLCARLGLTNLVPNTS